MDVPSLRVLSTEIEFIRRRNTARGPVGDLYTVGAEQRPQQAFNPSEDDIVVSCQVANAMIIGNACDWDNNRTAPVPIALVRPLRTLPNDAHDAIRRGENGRFLHLPENDDPALEESYVDFARTTSLRANVLDGYARLLSPSNELMTALYVALTYFYSRMEPDPARMNERAVIALRQADAEE
jgi:hypothetical protein